MGPSAPETSPSRRESARTARPLCSVTTEKREGAQKGAQRTDGVPTRAEGQPSARPYSSMRTSLTGTSNSSRGMCSASRPGRHTHTVNPEKSASQRS